MTDTSTGPLARMPHPARVRAGGVLKEMQRIFGDQFWQMFCEQAAHRASVMELGQFFVKATAALGPVNESIGVGSIDAMMAALILQQTGDRCFQYTDELQALLARSDIGADAPVQYLRPPYPSVYIEFGVARDKDSSLQLHHRLSGAHIVEGAYVFDHDIPANAQWPIGLWKYLGVDTVRPMRVVEVVLTGSPLGKADYLDDCTHFFMLYIQNEQETVETLIDKHLAYYASEDCTRDGEERMTEQGKQDAEQCILHLAKSLLYLHTHPETILNSERSDLEKQLKMVGQKKRARLLRRLPRTYDRVIVRPPGGTLMANMTTATHGERATHWRRGHFRQQACGPGHREHKLIFIEPTLVGGKGFGAAPLKPYVVK